MSPDQSNTDMLITDNYYYKKRNYNEK